jgi:hypothetical protein
MIVWAALSTGYYFLSAPLLRQFAPNTHNPDLWLTILFAGLGVIAIIVLISMIWQLKNVSQIADIPTKEHIIEAPVHVAETANVSKTVTPDLDRQIPALGKALLTQPIDQFEKDAKYMSSGMGADDLSYLKTRLHNPPAEPTDIKTQLRPGQWLAVCQYAIFELIYNMGPQTLGFLKSIAFGPYDWTQATALEVLCRMRLDGTVPDTIITELNEKMEGMRHETHAYLAQALISRAKRDERYIPLIDDLQSREFQAAVNEAIGV